MSTKGHILWDEHGGRIEAYNETSEPQYDITGKFLGWNVYLLIDTELVSINIHDGFADIKISIDIEYEIGNLPKNFRINLIDVFEIDIDSECVLFGFKGGSLSSELSFNSIPKDNS